MCIVYQLLACVIDVPKKLPHQKVIGESIRKYRKLAGMNQEELAEKADCIRFILVRLNAENKQ